MKMAGGILAILVLLIDGAGAQAPVKEPAQSTPTIQTPGKVRGAPAPTGARPSRDKADREEPARREKERRALEEQRAGERESERPQESLDRARVDAPEPRKPTPVTGTSAGTGGGRDYEDLAAP
jgi:hypothetical protein